MDSQKHFSIGPLSYNAPVTLTFTLIAVVVQAICSLPGTDWFHSLFVTYPDSLTNLLFYPRLFTHAIGHGGWEHLIGNFTLILLVGPMLEEKYGSGKILFMMFFTAIITAIINDTFFNTALCGASGIVFLFILLASCTSIKNNKIPITLILAVVFYLGQEILSSLKPDSVSQLAHIIGGICGAAFGLYFAKRNRNNDNPSSKGSITHQEDSIYTDNHTSVL